jgi:hypothetical protein
MKIRITCECGKNYEVPESYAGKAIRCKVCERRIHIPKLSTEADEDIEEEEESILAEPLLGNAISDSGFLKQLTAADQISAFAAKALLRLTAPRDL